MEHKNVVNFVQNKLVIILSTLHSVMRDFRNRKGMKTSKIACTAYYIRS